MYLVATFGATEQEKRIFLLLTMNDDEEAKGTNAQEEKELRRVFDHLAFYRDKKRIGAIIGEYKERRQQLESSLQNPKGVPVINAEGNRMSEEEVSKELEGIQVEIEKKITELHAVQNHSNRVIRQEDLSDAIKVSFIMVDPSFITISHS